MAFWDKWRKETKPQETEVQNAVEGMGSQLTNSQAAQQKNLEGRFETLEQDDFQGYGTVNYTVDEDFTRITEFKHLTGQVKPGVTTIVKEYSRSYTGAPEETPYYAIINPENNALYARYQEAAGRFPNLRLLGRLAEYKYYNMDAIVARALELSDQLI